LRLEVGKRMNHTEKEQSVHLTEYYYILTKHKWTIITSLIIIVALTMTFSFLMKPVYRATTTLIVEKEMNVSPVTGEIRDFNESYTSQSLTFNTHFKLVAAYAVMKKVVKTLKLDQLNREESIGTIPWRNLLSQFKKNIRLLLGREEKVLSPQEKLEQLIEELGKKINTEQVRDTRLLKVSVEDHDPVMAADIANTVAKSYIEFDIGNRLKSSQNTISWMTDQLYEMKKKLEDAEKEFLAYKQRANLFSIEGKQKVIVQKIEEFTDAYLKTRNERLELDAKLAELKRLFQLEENVLRIRSLIDNPLIDDLYSQLIRSEVELSHLRKIYKAKHPKIIQVKTKIDKTRKKVNEELKKELENLKAKRSVLLTREKVLAKTIADFERDSLETSKKELQYSMLERNVETNRKMYDNLLSRTKESNILGNAGVSNVRITEKATVPQVPVKPKKALNLILSIIFGLMTGVGISFLWEYLDRSLRTEEDVQRYLDLPVLSVIPLADQAKARTQGTNEVKK
jgi:uncharacterized protein involved in exopolysaccharide biosynthesis